MEDRGWVRIAVSAVVFQTLFCAGLGAHFGIKAPPPLIQYLTIGLGILISVSSLSLAWLAFPLRNEERPISRLICLLKLKSNHLPGLLLLLGLVAWQFSILTWCKTALAVSIRYWADPYLAELDEAIFGRDAWEILHTVKMDWIDLLYHAWLPTIFGSLVWFSIKNNCQALIAFFITSGLGTFSMFAMPSGGPIFYLLLGHGDRFADLPIQNLTGAGAEYLWLAYQGKGADIGAGISAMPSMHVALAVWVSLYFRTNLAYIWAFLIFIGSIYLGWHYVSDGVAGTFLAFTAYWIASRMHRESHLKIAKARTASTDTGADAHL